MAKWMAKSKTGGTLQGAIEYTGDRAGESHFKIYQDEKPFIEQAKIDRETMTRKDTGYRKFATIPDIVAIEVAQKWGIDIHDPIQAGDSTCMDKFKKIIKENYAYLLSYQEIMMATTRTYDELIALVRNWSNRDTAALPDAIIRDAIRYAVDKSYRHLRIPPLEHTVVYTSDMLQAATIGENNVLQSVTALAVPSDLIEFIQIRGVDAEGRTTRVFNEKNDIRSYWDLNNRSYNRQAFWSRQGDQILLTPAFGQIGSGYYGGFTSAEETIELYYYRRLPALNALFQATPNTFLYNLLTFVSPQPVTEEEIAAFLAIDGNGRLWFDDMTGVSVDTFQAGLLQTVADGTAHSDGSLWFHRAQIEYPVNVDNFNAGLLERTFEDPGTDLWFPPEQVVQTYQVPAGSNQFTLDENVIYPVDGTGNPLAVTDVTRIRDGAEQVLTIVRADVAITDDQVYVFGETRPTLAFSSPRVEDFYIVTYTIRPSGPIGTPEATQNSIGSLTAVPFRGLINYELVVPTLRVSATQTNFFDTEVRFTSDVATLIEPTPGTDTAYAADTTPPSRIPFYFSGTSVPNWFKDENERIALYGALAECFAYLQEDDQAGKFTQLMMKEIEELNEEDRTRDASGGNVQVQYNARGLI